MYSRTAASMVLLTALLAGTVSPMVVCALTCDRHKRAEAHHCGQGSDAMPGMAHDHSAMHHPGAEDVTLVARGQSCQTDCANVEQLNPTGKVVPQVKVVRTGAVVLVLDATSKFLAPQVVAAWSLDSGPPSYPSAHAPSYNVLRI